MELDRVKAKINRISKDNNIDVQSAWDLFFFDELLYRLSLSKYKNLFVLKGGFYLQSIVGIKVRSTMDLDLKMAVNDMENDEIKKMFEDIISVKSDTSIVFNINSISEIRAITKYGGKTVKIDVRFYNVKKTFGIDIGFGDVITPYPINYRYHLKVHDKDCDLWAYSIESSMSEKIEALVSKGINSSRSKDLLDLYLYSKQNYNYELLNVAVINSFNIRETKYDRDYLFSILNDMFNSIRIRELYDNYQNKHIFARDVSFDMCKDAIYEIASKLVFNDKICLEDYGIELHLVRHGDYVPTKVGGWTDDHLSEKGKSEIEVLLDIIDNHYDAFISSDLPRARETSKILNTKLKMDVNYNEGLREFDSGLLNKMTIQEFLKKYPNLYFQTIKMDERFPEGESPNLFYERVKGTFIKLLEENKNKKILLVTHGGVITIILCLIHGYPYNNNLQISPKTGSIIKLK